MLGIQGYLQDSCKSFVYVRVRLMLKLINKEMTRRRTSIEILIDEIDTTIVNGSHLSRQVNLVSQNAIPHFQQCLLVSCKYIEYVRVCLPLEITQ